MCITSATGDTAGRSRAAKALLAQADALDRSAADRRARQTRADAGRKDSQRSAAFGLNLGDMVMQMGVGGLVGKAGSLGLMGASVAGDTTLDSLERGGTPGQALANAAVAGAAEVLTEKLPVDQLFDLAKGPGKTGVRQVVRNLLGTMGSEGAQEAVTEIADNLADQAIMGDKSQYETYVRSLMEGGMDERSARNAAAKQFYLSNVGQAAMGGALLGGIMGGGAQLIGYANGAQGRRESRAIDRAHQTNTDSAAPQARKTASTGEAVKINPGARQTIREMISDMPNAGYQVPYVSMPKDALLGPDGVQVAENKIPAAIRRYMSKLFKGKVLKVGSDHKVYIDKGGIEEFTFPAKRMDGEMKTAKMAAGANLDTTLEPAVFLLNVEDDGHHPEATGGWDNFYVKFQTDTGTYSGVVKTKVTDRGRVFHDITEIQKEESPSARGDNGENPPPAWKSTSSFNTMIPQTGEGVKGEFSPKTDAVSPEDSTGAAPLGFDAYSHLQNQSGSFHPDGENAFRQVDVPTQDYDGRSIPKSAATVMESQAALDSAVAVIRDAIARGEFSFDIITDQAAGERARKTVAENGFDGAKVLFHQAASRGVVSKNDIALGQVLLNNAMNAGDSGAVIDILTDYSALSTASAQAMQAQRMLKKLSPEGQLYAVRRSVENYQAELQKKLGDKAPEITVDKALYQEFLDAGDQSGRDAAMEKILQNVADQVPATWTDKWNAWRYLSMLGNPRTHVRNIVGNAGFVPVRMVKDAIATVLESGVDYLSPKGIVRTKAALNPASQSDRALVRACFGDIANVEEQLLGSGKYSESAAGQIRDRQTINKLPGQFQQMPYIDAWGRTESSGSLPERAFNNFPNPSYVSKETVTAADRELQRLKDAGQDGVFPQRVSQSEKVDGLSPVPTCSTAYCPV